MILYTIFDPNVVFQNGIYGENQINKKYSEIQVDGVMVQVSQTGDSDLCIERIISTNPFDYLKNNLQPGSIINID